MTNQRKNRRTPNFRAARPRTSGRVDGTGERTDQPNRPAPTDRPVQPVQSAQPIQPAQPVQAAQPIQPAQPVQPATESTPAEAATGPVAGAQTDGIPNPADKPRLDSGVDPNNVLFNGVSLLNAKDDDNWDIPSLSFPVIDERGVAATPAQSPATAAFASPDATATPGAAGTPTTATPASPAHTHIAEAMNGAGVASATVVPPAPTTPVDATQTLPTPPAAPVDSGSETTVLPPLGANAHVSGFGMNGTDGTDSGLSRLVAGTNAAHEATEGAVNANGGALPPSVTPGAEHQADGTDSPFGSLADVADAATETNMFGDGPLVTDGPDGSDAHPHGGSASGHDGSDGTRASGRKPLIIGIAAAVLVVAAVGGFIAFRGHQKQAAYDTALSSCQAAADDVATANSALNAVLKKADTASQLGVDQVDDATTISKLKSVMSDATGTDKASSCDASLPTAELSSRAAENTKLASTIDAHASKVTAAVKAVTASEEKKAKAEIKTVKASLESAVSEARTLMTNSEGAVTDDSTRQTLQSAIDKANTLIKDSDPKLADLNSALSAIQSATSDVNDSMSSYTYSRRRYYSNSNSGSDGTTNSNGTNGTTNGYSNNGYGNRGNGYYNTGSGGTWSGSQNGQSGQNQNQGQSQNQNGQNSQSQTGTQNQGGGQAQGDSTSSNQTQHQ